MDKKPNIGICGLAGSGKDTTANILSTLLFEKGLVYQTYAFARPLKEFAKEVFLLRDFDVYDQFGKEVSHIVEYDYHELKFRFFNAFAELMDALVANEPIYTTFWDGSEDQAQTYVDYYFDKMIQVLDKYIVPETVVERIKRTVLPYSRTVKMEFTPRILLQLLGTEFFRETIADNFWTAIAPTEGTIFTDMRFVNEADFIKETGGVLLTIVRPGAKTTASNTHASENVGPVAAKCDWIIINSGTMDDLRGKAEKFIEERVF